MSVKIRLARGGSKKNPFYQVVVANNTAPRDGDFIENLGYFNPMKKDEASSKIKLERVEHWVSVGAEPTYRVLKILSSIGFNLPEKFTKILEAKKNNPKKPSKKDSKAA